MSVHVIFFQKTWRQASLARTHTLSISFAASLILPSVPFLVGHNDIIEVLVIAGRDDFLLFLEKTHGPGRTGDDAVAAADAAIEVDE